MSAQTSSSAPKPAVQACRYKTGKQLGTGSYSVVKECVHIDTGRYYAAKVINKRLMAGREHMVSLYEELPSPARLNTNRCVTKSQCSNASLWDTKTSSLLSITSKP